MNMAVTHLSNASTVLLDERVHQDNLTFAHKTLSVLEGDVAAELYNSYCYRYRKYNPRSANIWLRKQVAAVKAHEERFPIALHHLATEVKRTLVATEWANRTAAIVTRETQGFTQTVNAEQLLKLALQPARQWGFSPLLPTVAGEPTDEQLDVIASAIMRLQCPQWWERKITIAWRRYHEHMAIIAGKVRRGTSPYVSELAAKDYRTRQLAGARWLQTMFAVNEELGLEIPLAEAVNSSMANPELRRMELMMRMRGFEDLAQEQGLVGEFYTVTAPSRFHAWSTTKSKTTIQNERYDGSTPRHAQAYLCGQWAKARAKLARLGVKVFGFRVAEPHHDGTPHWHLLLFTHPATLRLLRSVLRKYAVQHHKDELGRRGYKARFDFQTIDPEKGSATGYIAKYISKNINGYKVGIDEETGTDASDTASNVTAWSSLWGIRQFQQVGGPSVSVWRELRRLREATQNPIIEPARMAADTGKWDRFVQAMGGIDAQRKDHLIQLRHLINEAASKYGEDVKKLQGVITLTGDEFQTRHMGWELSRTGLGSSSGGSRAPWSSDNNCTQGSNLAEKDPLGRQLEQLGLDNVDLARLKTGAVITMDGQFISIRNGTLGVSRTRPGSVSGRNPLDDQIDRDFAQLERERAADYRAQALELLDQGKDLERWLALIPEQYQKMALDQAAELVEQMEEEARWLNWLSPEHRERAQKQTDDFAARMASAAHFMGPRMPASKECEQ